MNCLPTSIIEALSDKNQILASKYELTYSDVSNDIGKAESTLSSLIGELTGNESDMKALNELKSLLNSAD